MIILIKQRKKKNIEQVKKVHRRKEEVKGRGCHTFSEIFYFLLSSILCIIHTIRDVISYYQSLRVVSFVR